MPLGIVNRRHGHTHHPDSLLDSPDAGTFHNRVTNLAVVYAEDYRIKRRPLRDGGQSCIYRKSF